MIAWIILGILVFLIFVFMKAKYFQHRFYIIFFLFLAVFLFLTGMMLIGQYNLSFKNSGDFINFAKVYLSWITASFHNVKTLAGNAVNMDWNSTSVN